jgi:ATP-dependent DNA helicase RecG
MKRFGKPNMETRYRERGLLEESSQFIKGVGPARQVLLERLGITTVEDLISHFPRGYYDRRDLVPVAKIPLGAPATFIATILAISPRKARLGRTILTVAVGDETGVVSLVFFNQPYLEKYFKQGERVVVSGVLGLYKDERQIVSPEYEIIGGELTESLLHAGRIVPVYPLTAGISQRMMRKIVMAAFEKCSGHIRENLTPALMKAFGVPAREEAFRQVHYPDDYEGLERARRRFKIEEVFFLHLLLKERRSSITKKRRRPPVAPPHPLLDRFLAALPFALTAAQRRALDEIRADVERGGLNRLLQGEVGSGKTVVALAATMLALGKGYQAAFMAPTEILALQHYERTRQYCEGLGIGIELLIGSTPRADKKRIQEALRAGSVDLIVGTHALIQEVISFKQLGLAVIDEQHRFGVKQRAKFGQGDLVPHFLVMTATPIPRSLAQTVYGDLDLSIIDELPAGKRRVRTGIVAVEERERVYDEIRAAFRESRQAFILYPLVQESERSDFLAATEEFERLQREEFSEFPLGLLHGRMSFEEKSRAIDLFRRGEILGLVTTTVIEVGVDIPNASILLVNNPERFGLAQLHQLRGRVGRGGKEGLCYLLLGGDVGALAHERLSFFASHDDGFEVAERDLRLRGPGEIWGYRQSGYPHFKLINPLSDHDLVQLSWDESERLLERDPELSHSQNRALADYFRQYYKPRMELAEIG